jgi:diphosphomevalonate decarboxylase
MQGIISYSCPANISLIKNFGGYRKRTQGNPSFSMTLDKAKSETTVKYTHSKEQKFSFTVTINGVESEYLKKRISHWFEKVVPVFPWINQTSLEISVTIEDSLIPFVGIYTVMCSLTFCLSVIANHLGKLDAQPQLQTVSSIALLDSENAARSTYGGFVGLGKNAAISWSSDKYASQYQREAMIYSKLNDTILSFDNSSHNLSELNPEDLYNHPYLESRIKHAQINPNQFLRALDDGHWDLFEHIVENEALTMCALFLSSGTSKFLPSSNLIEWAQYIRDKREEIECPVTFTFDRELRLHLIYPPIAKEKVIKLLEESPLTYDKLLHDNVGKGPKMLKDSFEQ